MPDSDTTEEDICGCIRKVAVFHGCTTEEDICKVAVFHRFALGLKPSFDHPSPPCPISLHAAEQGPPLLVQSVYIRKFLDVIKVREFLFLDVVG